MTFNNDHSRDIANQIIEALKDESNLKRIEQGQTEAESYLQNFNESLSVSSKTLGKSFNV